MATGLKSKLISYGDDDFSLFLRKAFIKGAGYTDDALSRPIIGIIDTSSGFNPCHGNIPSLIKALERSILLSGALPIPFPTISLHESFANPSSMLLRNLMSMDTEEMIRAQPMDAVVLIGGCDKTVPAQICGAVSANVPAIALVTGPMLTGSHRGARVGACTDCRSHWKRFRAAEIDLEEITLVNDELVPGVGTCGVMASTMACLIEVMGLMPLGSSTPPAVSSARLRIAEKTGCLAATHARPASAHLRPQLLLKKANFENALVVLQAIGGSTNAIVHVLAIAGRVPGLDITLDDLSQCGRTTPLLVDLKPSGNAYMEDFHRAGGMPALLLSIRHLLDLSAMTITGETLGQALLSHPSVTFAQTIIRPPSDPVFPHSALVVLRGNLAPSGCIIKQSAATPSLLTHRGPALVFSSPTDLAARIDSPDLPATPDTVLVLTHIGPVGAPGFPEAGLIPIPRKLALQGVQDMLRISDGRMSGTAQGTVVVHVAPEAAVPGGVLGIVRDGDVVGVDVRNSKIWVELGEDVIRERLELKWKIGGGKRQVQKKKRGYRGLYVDTVSQADRGADFDWLRADGDCDDEERTLAGIS